MKNFKPLLSGHFTSKVERRFPYLASPKLDGIRCVIIDGVALSRTLKPIPNKHIQSLLGNPELNGLDGEIICGSPTHPDCFRNTSTVVMAHAKVEDFTFHVFDDFSDPSEIFFVRLKYAKYRVEQLNTSHIGLVEHKRIDDEEQLFEAEAECHEKGYEGMMLRYPQGVYKFGRSTDKEQILLKVKRFTDSDARVVGFLELEHNENEKTVNELGRSKRSSHQEGKVLAGTLGTLLVKDIHTGVEFGIGTGLTAKERQDIWDNRQNIVGNLLKYKFFPFGVFEKPRHPVFLGWRPVLDMEI
jgi:DNA ligase-1